MLYIFLIYVLSLACRMLKVEITVLLIVFVCQTIAKFALLWDYST
mgnify:CR=1 FL=1